MKRGFKWMAGALLLAGALQGQNLLQGSLSDMRGAACTPGTGGYIPIAIYLQPAPNFGYLSLLRFCDSKSKLWFPLPMATNTINGEVLSTFTSGAYPNGAAALSRTPVSISSITRNGLTLKQGVDYTFQANVVTFLFTVDPNDSLLAWYSY